LLSSTPLTLAETASVFGEMLTFRKMLDGAKTDAERKVLLAGKVEDMINTVVRQIAFYDFECKLHAARREGELTPDDIGALWMSVQGESLGRPSTSWTGTRPSGPTSRISCTRPSTSTPMPSATGW
jgi:oligoendopeptidase F